MINKLCIIGVGLIGGSVARALRSHDACREIVGCSRHVKHLEHAVKLGVIDRFDTRITVAIEGADVILIAVPVGAFEAVLREIAATVGPAAIITDVGSTKGSVVKVARTTLGSHLPMFVPAHPIAGGEQSGVAAADAKLFEDARVVLTPLAETRPEATLKIRGMWEQVGAQVTSMSAAEHDRILAATSHLPHMLAYSLVDMLATMNGGSNIFDYTAGGFRDFTRIASSDPRMWHDICLANREALLEMLEKYGKTLQELQQAIEHGDSARIMSIFAHAKRARDELD